MKKIFDFFFFLLFYKDHLYTHGSQIRLKLHYYRLLLQHCCDSIQQYCLLSFTFVYCCIGKSTSQSLSENSLTIPLFCHMTAVPLCIEQSSTVHYLISCNAVYIYVAVLFQGSLSNSKIKGKKLFFSYHVLS